MVLAEKRVMKLFVLLASVVLTPLLFASGWPQQAGLARAGAIEDDRLTGKVGELLNRGIWCHRSHAPVGFVLNFFHFDDREVRIESKYVSDEGTVMRKATFAGSWSVTASAADVVGVHFEIATASDEDLPPPRDLSLRVIGDDKLAYSNGEKFNLVSDENGFCG
jgi:hypothetical protein